MSRDQGRGSPRGPGARSFALLAAMALFALVIVSCNDDDGGGGGGATGSAADIAEARGLSDADVAAALKTYVPSGQIDEYLTFASGGQ